MEYTIRRAGGEASGRMLLDDAEIRLGIRLLNETTGPRHAIVDGKEKGDRTRLLSILEDVDIAFRETKAERVIIDSKTGVNYIVKAFEPEEQVIDTPGTKSIDRIYTAVHRKFEAKYLVRDMGICANKPGEHLHCNAWDGGTNADAPAEVQHARILEMADYIRNQGNAFRESNGQQGLPAFGVIVMDKFWRFDMGDGYHPYGGTKHVSHFHVAGRPSFTGHI